MILLHGWLGSWGLWQETMAYLGRHYRTYALDFWGFGESGKKRDTYAVQDFVSLVDQFMEQLGIAQAPLVGHSMGGTVSLSVAIQHPERVREGGGGRLADRGLVALLAAQAVWAAPGGLRGAPQPVGPARRLPHAGSACTRAIRAGPR